MPAAIAAQNCRRSSRPATGGRPGENNGARPDLSERRLRLVIATLPLKVLRRPFESGQYACGAYVARLDGAGIQPSMSRIGCPWDNAVAESFMRTLKKEEVDGRAYRDLADARASIGQFIDGIYNNQRLHSALDYLPPLAFEPRLSAGPPHLPPADRIAPAMMVPCGFCGQRKGVAHNPHRANNKPI